MYKLYIIYVIIYLIILLLNFESILSYHRSIQFGNYSIQNHEMMIPAIKSNNSGNCVKIFHFQA